MARSDLLVRLIKSGSQGDVSAFRRSAESLIAEERAKKHNILADRLLESLRMGYGRTVGPTMQRESRDPGSEYFFEQEPKLPLDDLILASDTQVLCRELIEEHHRSELLLSYGMEPRSKVLLAGEPGNGKTSLAETLAYELMVPFLVVRYETLIGSFLGETASRLQKVFEYAATRSCVLFFDEFDTVGKERGDQKEMGEIKRVVSSLLMQMDRLPSHVLVVAASNHPELLDKAVWRRFQVRLNLPKPTKAQGIRFLEVFFEKHKMKLSITEAQYGSALAGLSYAELTEFCLDVLRRSILDRTDGALNRIFLLKIKQWKSRSKVNMKPKVSSSE